MIMILLTLILSSIAVYVTAQILPGVRLEGFGTAVVVAVVLGLVNAFIRPLLLLLTLPINILTLGLFTLVIMGFCAWLVSQIVPGFAFASFWWAIGFAFVFAIINSFLNSLA